MSYSLGISKCSETSQFDFAEEAHVWFCNNAFVHVDIWPVDKGTSGSVRKHLKNKTDIAYPVSPQQQEIERDVELLFVSHFRLYD